MPVIQICGLTFFYDDRCIFRDLSLQFEAGGRYLIVGLNGCGKSTLLKLLGGKMLSPSGSIQVLDKDPFRDTILNNHISFLNNEWGTRTVAYSGYNMPLQSGMQVKEMMVVLKEKHPERNRELMDVLKINPEWKLNAISEGQRKRVQLYLGLIQPFDICLLDEITVNLDILIKDRFMEYLKKESRERNCCILYITHIFDGLDDWCTHLLHIQKNSEVGYFGLKPEGNMLYPFLLSLLQKEEDNIPEEEERKPSNYRKNAGGYTSGVLIDYKKTY